MFILKLGRHIGACVCEYTHTVSEVVVMMYATRAGIWTVRNK